MRTWCTPHATEEFKNVRDRNPKPSEAEINHSRKIMRLWELICKEDLDVQEVWSGVTAKPEPLPHDQKERDGNCAEECDDSVFDRSNAERLEVTKKINSICKVDGHEVTTTKVLTATTKTDRTRTERSTTTTSLSTTTEATASTTTTHAVPEETTTLPIRTPPPDLSTTLTSKWIYPSTEASHQCHECFQPYAWCEVNATIPGVCEKCACPHGRTGSCCETIIDFCAVEGADPCKDDTLDMHRQCEVNWVSGWTRCVCNSGWEGRNCTEKILACEANRCVNGGTCVDDEKGNFTCTCLPEYKGRFCEMKSECHPRCYPCVQDDPRCKHGSSCWPNNNATKDDHFKCICERGFKGEFCEEDIPCVTRNPCKNGGECYRENGKAVCECMSIWTGDFCETFNICYNERYKCGGGVCEAINATSFRCNCFVSYTGEFCEEQVNFCDPNPCLNNMTCARLEGGFNCICGEGTTGRFCEDDHNDCEIEENGAKLKNRCSRRDKKAKCFDQVNDFFCECSQKWVGKECTMRREIYDVLKHFKTYDDGTVKMLEDILDKPELIKETLPFFLALQPNQSTISWEHGDLFEWASFEGRELDVATDLVKWNEATLGNCFTFNHESRPQKFGLRYNGEREGFRTALNLRQDEYLSWIDTASILVFVHPHTETIFGESLRFQAKPGGQTSIMTSLVSYERLGGSYGRCVSDNSEIDSYYYSGDYTTDGCLRSCYQDAVFKECKCMDPRFPLKEDVEVCDLSKRICAVGLTQRRGDPSNWPECNCPLPCTNGQFNVRWSRTSFGNMTESCDKTIQVKESRERCVRRADRVEIFVSMPYIIQNIYKEEPKTDFNKFIANLGGLLGILCGICIITLIEFAYLIVRLFVFLCFGK
ncbi:hypothetical protein L596_007636 [Steinernema carpocapsae]|uniref:EGF-like domain-containing protein n=1 Tax=Steinernema carpocapsae TaxID=34508 RepID=A0A4U5PA04_STECR|nr:hypothetical protein L596_007636 [Steinernema carpocapsae]